MAVTRQDAWSEDEDLLLAEVVLRHIRESSTQLAAFEEVGRKLSRSSAACGFRWNSSIRKRYESAVALAKKQKNKRAESTTSRSIPVAVEPIEDVGVEQVAISAPVNGSLEKPKALKKGDLTLNDVIAFLTQYQSNESSKNSVEYEELKQENQQLRQTIEQIKRDKELITQDYKALLTIMDRARKFTRDHPIERTI
ncbi:RsfA family transcriptional regulator [Alkalicoccobacillus porphyridii]|uniref:RsfA family transcriptional regulator n=1 Tax=Alkalicoccobacillus porphyridii TaxID=2597270 RepID=A0A553ZXZ3_9BACI|nr:RsfA family transcriptional regulator [Alkalicoccobacillus porphyridii]TSB46313.1 RsfA family transcriptional regulator [Alkalicoccobacillus porphyridii]